MMRLKIQKLIEEYKKGNASSTETVNKIMELSVVKKDDVEICFLCKEHLVIDGECPRCSIDLCTPLEKWK